MRIWKNLDRMNDSTYRILKYGFLYSALLLGIGIAAILRENWQIAEICRELSQVALLLTTVTSCVKAAKE